MGKHEYFSFRVMCYLFIDVCLVLLYSGFILWECNIGYEPFHQSEIVHIIGQCLFIIGAIPLSNEIIIKIREVFNA